MTIAVRIIGLKRKSLSPGLRGNMLIQKSTVIKNPVISCTIYDKADTFFMKISGFKQKLPGCYKMRYPTQVAIKNKGMSISHLTPGQLIQ